MARQTSAILIVGCLAGCGATPPRNLSDTPLSAHLSVDGGPSCLSADELGRRLSDALERRVVAPEDRADVHVAVTIRDDGDAHEARVVTSLPAGTRLGLRTIVVDGDGCQVVNDQLVFVIALVLDSPAVQEAVQRGPPQPFDEPRPDTLLFGLRAGASHGLQPGAAAAGGLYVEYDPGSFVPLRLELVTSLPVERVSAGLGARYWSASGALLSCPALRLGRLRLGACAGPKLGLLHGTGIGYPRVDSALSPTLSVASQLLVELSFSPIRISFSVQGAVLLLRDSFALQRADETLDTLHEPDRFSGETGIGIGWFFDL